MEVQQPELKKKHSSRREGEVEVDSLVERTQGTAATGGRGQARQQLVDPMRQQLVHWMVPYSHADNLGGITWGAR